MAGFSIGPFSVTGLTNPEAIVLFIFCFLVVLLGGYRCCRRRRNQQPQQRPEAMVQMDTINIDIGNSEGEPSGGRQEARLPVMYAPAYYPRDDEVAIMYAPAYYPRDDEMAGMYAADLRDDEMAEDYHTNGE